MSVKALSNTITIGTANTVYLATAVRVTNDNTARTLIIANTAAPNDSGAHGGYVGGRVELRLAPNEVVVISKKPRDTVTCNAAVYATKVADHGGF